MPRRRKMAYYVARPRVEPVPERDYYRLTEDWAFSAGGRYFDVPKYFEFDGASIPRPVWTLLGVTPFDPDVLGPACAHDWLYLTRRTGRAFADRVFKDLLTRYAAGLHPFKILLMYLAVRSPVGAWAWRLDKSDKGRLVMLKYFVSKRDDRARFFDYERNGKNT